MRQADIIFTRVPEAGRTKTRMMPHLTPKQCELLHTCFLEDIRKECETCSADVFVYYTLEKNINEPIIKSILGKQTGYFAQTGEGLGERMYNALAEVFEKGYEKCILIGTDVPEVQST